MFSSQMYLARVYLLLTLFYSIVEGVSVHYAYKVYNFERGAKNDAYTDTGSEILPFCRSQDDRWFSIKMASSDLVVEVTEPIQEFLGKPQQLWKFETADRPGVYYIVSKDTRKVLQVQQDTRKLNLKKKNGFENQKWVMNHNGRLYNIGTKHILDVPFAKSVPGTVLQVVGDFNGNIANEFMLQEKLLDDLNTSNSNELTAY